MQPFTSWLLFSFKRYFIYSHKWLASYSLVQKKDDLSLTENHLFLYFYFSIIVTSKIDSPWLTVLVCRSPNVLTCLGCVKKLITMSS